MRLKKLRRFLLISELAAILIPICLISFVVLQIITTHLQNEVFKKNGLALNIAMEVTGREAVKTYVETGLGISIINEYYLTSEDRKKLFCKDVSRYFGQAERGILTRKGKYLSKTTQQLIKNLAR